MRVIIREYPRDLPYLTLYPIADVHWGAAECMERELGISQRIERPIRSGLRPEIY